MKSLFVVVVLTSILGQGQTSALAQSEQSTGPTEGNQTSGATISVPRAAAGGITGSTVLTVK